MDVIPTLTRSAIWAPENSLKVLAEEMPLVAAGELLIRIRAAGICGSDLHRFQSGNRRTAEGLGPGHELAGEVVRLGPGVCGPDVGTRVVVFAGKICSACAFCLTGRSQLCGLIRLAGQNYPGGIAEHFVAQAGMVFPIPGDLDWPLAALAEPFSVAIHGLERARMATGQRVLVIGAGTIGLATALAAVDANAARVGIVARYRHQADVARLFGVDDVFDADELRINGLARSGWDIVVESVGGSQQTLQQAVRLVTPGGTVLLLGVHQSPQTIEAARIFRLELTVVGSFGCNHLGDPQGFVKSLTLINKYRYRVRKLITHTFPLDEVNQAFKTAFDRMHGAIKVTVLP